MSATGRISITAAVILSVTLAVVTIALVRSTARATPSTDPILEIDSTTLTSYKPGASGGQDVSPIPTQRGVGIDGTLRAAPSLPMAIAGNPFAPPQCGKGSKVRDGLGSYQINDVDIGLPSTGFGWVVGRSYNALQDASGDHNSAGFMGNNWFSNSQPEIMLYGNEASRTANDVLYLIYGADRFVEYKRVSASSEFYKGTNGAAGVFEYISGSPDTYKLTDMNSNEITFFGFDTDSSRADGQFWKMEDNDSNVAYVGHKTSASTADDSYTNQQLRKAYDTDGRVYTYDYTSGQLDYVEVKKSVSDSTVVARVDYTYYGASEDHGVLDDLKMVKVKTYMSDSSVQVIQKKYYRYWKDADTEGDDHQIKMIVGFEGTRNYDWSDSTFDEDFVTETDENLKPYSDAYFEYDSSDRLTKVLHSGNCGCGGSSNDGEFVYTYGTNSSYTDGSGYDDIWATRTIVDRPDGPDDSWSVLYFDEAGQPLSRALADGNPSGSPNWWVTDIDRNSAGLLVHVASPESVSSYTHSTGAVSLSTTTGRIVVYTRISSGAAQGYLEHTMWKEGSSGTAYYSSTLAYDTSRYLDFGAPVVSMIRPVISTRGEYHTETTSTSGSTDWTYATTFYGTSPKTLAIETVTTTEPAVAAAKNGSASANTTARNFNEDGSLAFTKDQEGHIGYREYTGGRLTKSVVDANTASLSPPSGFAHTGSPINQVTTYTYDNQGRLDTTMLPYTRVLKRYYSRLSDHRFATLAYNAFEDLSTDKYHGPVRYSVRLHNGQSSAQGAVELSSNESTLALASHVNESTDDAVGAVASLGTVTGLTTSQYTDSGGQLESTRTYFSTPPTPFLPGTDGTHYDPTTFTYDDLGRRTHVTHPSGTIRKTIFDIHGGAKNTWIGTVDGGGGDNMVKTSENVYDGGSTGKNRYLTKVTRFVVDGTTNKRETIYTNDVHGQAVIVQNPQAPHSMSTYDNMGRTTATGLYSSAPLSAASPVSTSSNRVALTQTAYDELGRAYEVKRHKIDAADGSDDDNVLTSTWYDKRWNAAKVDGETLFKQYFDRVGRSTHRFVLASDNDTIYSQALDVTGDKVLEEYQILYGDDHAQPLGEAVITRDHDDTSSTGALDSNGDTEDLEFAAADISGRIQINAVWYDNFLRVEDEVAFGTNGGADWDRDASPPVRSDTALRTTYTYNTAGQVENIADPKDLDVRIEYDDQGRKTKEIANHVSAGVPANPDDNRTSEYTYTDSLLVTTKVDMPSASDDQTTTYTYGITTSASDIVANDILHKVAYPDSTSGSDLVTMEYNAQGEVIKKTDQAGNVFDYTYDTRGRLTDEYLSTIATASGFDNYVDRKVVAYTDLGQVQKVTQKSVGTVLDEVELTYDGWGLVTKYDQDHDSAITGGGSYAVAYTYSKNTSGRNTVRRVDMNYAGIDVDFNYDTGIDNDSSRVSEVEDSTNTQVVAEYEYQGISQLVRTNYPESDAFSSLYNPSGGALDRLDEFNRVVTSLWTKDLATDVDFYDVDVAYDRNSNITLIEDNVHARVNGVYPGFDVEYTNDDLNRLTQAEEGTWNGSSITNKTRDEQWTLTVADVMSTVNLDLNGDGDFVDTNEHADTRTYNKANELQTRSSPGSYTLTHDAVGNMTDDGKSYTYKYDPFGRLVEVKQRGSPYYVIAKYRYNGLGHRVQDLRDTNGDGKADDTAGDLWFDNVYDDTWRRIATYRRTGPSAHDSNPKERFIHNQAGLSGSVRNLDSVVLRDKDANTAWASLADGTLEERNYYCQNWRGDLSVIVDDQGRMVEWVKYSSYGVPFGLCGGDADSDGDCDGGDLSRISTWISTSVNDVRGDLDIDGDVDSGDYTRAQSVFNGTTLGRGSLSAIGNRVAYAGYECDADIDQEYHIRHRVLAAMLGQWSRRDPLEYVDGTNMYSYVSGRPMAGTDPMGLRWVKGPKIDYEITRTKIRNNLKEHKLVWNAKPCTRISQELLGLGWAFHWFGLGFGARERARKDACANAVADCEELCSVGVCEEGDVTGSLQATSQLTTAWPGWPRWPRGPKQGPEPEVESACVARDDVLSTCGWRGADLWGRTTWYNVYVQTQVACRCKCVGSEAPPM